MTRILWPKSRKHIPNFIFFGLFTPKLSCAVRRSGAQNTPHIAYAAIFIRLHKSLDSGLEMEWRWVNLRIINPHRWQIWRKEIPNFMIFDLFAPKLSFAVGCENCCYLFDLIRSFGWFGGISSARASESVLVCLPSANMKSSAIHSFHGMNYNERLYRKPNWIRMMLGMEFV